MSLQRHTTVANRKKKWLLWYDKLRTFYAQLTEWFHSCLRGGLDIQENTFLYCIISDHFLLSSVIQKIKDIVYVYYEQGLVTGECNVSSCGLLKWSVRICAIYHDNFDVNCGLWNLNIKTFLRKLLTKE